MNPKRCKQGSHCVFNEQVALYDYCNLNPPPHCYRLPLDTHEQISHTHCPEPCTQMEKCNLKGLYALRDAEKIRDVDKRERGTKQGRQQKKMREDECKKL